MKASGMKGEGPAGAQHGQAALPGAGMQAVIDALPDAMIALSADGELLAVNAAFCDMWDMPVRLRERPEARRILWHFLAQLSQPARVSRLLEDALARSGEPGARVIAAADARRIECRHRPVMHEGEPRGLLISMRDVTAPLPDAQEAYANASNDIDGGTQAKLQETYGLLSRKSEQLELVLQHMSQGIVRIQADGRITFYNERLLQLLDLPQSLMDHHPSLYELQAFQRARGDFGAGDRFFDKELRDTGFTTRQPDAVPYYVRRSRSGALIEVRTQSMPDGGWLRTFADVTEHMNALGAQSRGEALVRSLVETLPDAVWIKDPHGEYLACNPAFVQSSGYTHESIVGRRDVELFPPDVVEHLRRADRLAIERGHLFTETSHTLLPGQPKRNWEVRRAAVRDARGVTTAILGIARDVTERRRTQDLLERSNRLLAVSQAMAKVGGWEVDLPTGTVFWTDQVYRMLDTSPGRYTPTVDTTIQFFAPDYVPVIRQAIIDAESTGKTHDLEVQMITATGRHIWVHTVSNVLVVRGRIVKRVSTLQDITRRKQSEHEQVMARESKRRMAQQLDMTVSGATLGLWSMHLPSDQILLSGQWEAILGVSFDDEPRPREMRTQLIHPGDRPGANEAFVRHVKGVAPQFEHEMRMRHAGGQWIWVRCRGRVVKRDASGRPVLVAGIAKDIGAEIEMRHAASRQQQMLQAMIDGIETGILINDGHHVIFMNAMFRRLLGYGADQDLGFLSLDDLVAPEDRQAAAQRRQIVGAGGRVPMGWMNLLNRRGEIVQMALSTSRISLGNRLHYISTANQLSEQQMLDVRIRNTQARFERLLVSELEKQQAHIARELHDSLGSELAAVSLMVGGLQSITTRNTRLAQGLVRVQQQVQSAAGITRLLARGLMPVDDHPGALWNALEQLSSSTSALRGVSCELKLEGQDTGIAAEARNHLYRIAQEAITNALRHGKPSRIEIRVFEVDERCCMEIEADGNGFDAAAMTGPGHTGIGLRSIMARAKTIGGSVEFTPKNMGGSCVSVYWPKGSIEG
ncbi:MAG: PAS domain S-box protein [Comamonadaceae bacterium]|nr:MAG: PAS domain S-box protein [Comamonadaceae bacterium]